LLCGSPATLERAVAKRKYGARGLSKLQREWIKPPNDRLWARLFIDVIDGAAWRGLSVNARRVLDALICHHLRDSPKENGNIKISHLQFEAAGVTRRLITRAIRELESVKFITIRQGKPSKFMAYAPILYGLPMYAKEPEGFLKAASRPFVWVPVEVMESAKWCGLSINARRIIDRLLLENFRHKAEANGTLRVSVRQFAEHGINRRFAASAIKELTEAGFLAVTYGKSRGSQLPPNIYRIAFLGTLNGPPTWRKPAETNDVRLPNLREMDSKPIQSEKFLSTPEGAPDGAIFHPPKVNRWASFLHPPKVNHL